MSIQVAITNAIFYGFMPLSFANIGAGRIILQRVVGGDSSGGANDYPDPLHLGENGTLSFSEIAGGMK